MPVRSRSVISLMFHSPRPASLLEVSEGAYQFCIGMRPPSNALDSGLPPSALIGEWHIAQWPNPSTRYAPRFHSADLDGSGLYSPSWKNKVRQPRMRYRLLNGKRRSLGRFGCRTGGTERRYAEIASQPFRATLV